MSKQIVTIPRMKMGVLFRMPNAQKAIYLIPRNEPQMPKVDIEELNVRTARQLKLIDDLEFMKRMSEIRNRKTA